MPQVNNATDMNRVGFVKSNFKMYCDICHSNINRGDEITRCVETDGMELRARSVAGSICFYTPFTGARLVHKRCKQSFVWTEFAGMNMAKIYEEFPSSNLEEWHYEHNNISYLVETTTNSVYNKNHYEKIGYRKKNCFDEWYIVY